MSSGIDSVVGVAGDGSATQRIPTMAALAKANDDRMHCMEVWGGNSFVDRSLSTPGLEVWVHSRPYEGADNGGDIYYVSSCASGRITRLLLADVSGHGDAASRVSTGLRKLMKRNVNLIDQSRFVGEMNRQFADCSEPDEFASAVVFTFFSPTGSLQFCNAGHPVPYLYLADRKQWVLASEVAGLQQADGIADTPLGAIDGAEYSKFDLRLKLGDMVMCVSDAFIEAVDENSQMLGTDGLLRMLNQLQPNAPGDIVQLLTDQVTTRHVGNLKSDDATVMLIRADGSAPTLVSDLLTPIRLLRGVLDS